MLGHLSFGVSDLARAIAFYDAVLEPLGYVRLWTEESGAGYGAAGTTNDRLALFQQTTEVRPPAPGFHLAFVAPDREAVNEFHAAALKFGGKDEGAAGPRPHYGPTYYAAFVLDPDGHKLEAVCQ
jgi:catechol 2,3-dioxygenase-like lactoylglutathione lyase family enzyme